MPLISKRERVEKKTLTVQVPVTVYDDLKAYAGMLDSDIGHVVSGMLEYVIAKDKDFQAWRQREKTEEADQPVGLRALA